jgi:TPR repeat protein
MSARFSLAGILLLLALLCTFHVASVAPPVSGQASARSQQDRKKAAGEGDAEAQFQLGVLAQQAPALAEGRRASLPWFRQAARQGHVRAQYELGLAYVSHSSEERHLPLAEKWLTRAASHGDAQAWLALGDLYAEGGPGVLQDLARAEECYLRAGAKGQHDVWYALGGVYLRGNGGITKDWPRAYHYYFKAANQGHRESQHELGQLYQYGIGTAVDLERAVHWYTQAAKQEDARAAEKLGWLYEHGIGLAADREQALAWYKQSDQLGGYCRTHRERLGDPELPAHPATEDHPVSITTDVEITLEPDKAEYTLDDLVIIAVRYRNVSKETYSFEEGHTGAFHQLFSVKNEKGEDLPDPYRDPAPFQAGSFLSSTNVLKPGQSLVIQRTLNQGVHFERPGTYTVSTSQWVNLGKGGWSRDWAAVRKVEAKPITVKVRQGDPEKRRKDIDALVKAYRAEKGFPEGMTLPAEHFDTDVNILRRLVFYHEPTLLPFFLDELERERTGECPETGLRVLPDRAAVLRALEERLEHPEKYRTPELLHSYERLAGLAFDDWFGEPGRLDNWKRAKELEQRHQARILEMLHDDTQYRYGELAPGLLGGSDDLFLIDYVIRCRPNLDLIRRCAGALAKVNLARGHIPFLESLLKVKNDWDVTDAAILQLVRLDRDRYLPALKAHRDNFSPEIVKLLLEPADG